jgi:ATP-dependent Clp protease adaptor protein ClpS
MKLFILNDDINSFEHVVTTIQRYCNYPHTQGQSIASIVHSNGQCCIKESEDEEMMVEMYDGMKNAGLKVKMEA